MKSFRVGRLRASTTRNRSARDGRVAGSVDVRSAPAKAGASAPWHGRTGSKESARPRNATTRKEVIRRVARRAPDGGADSTWLSRVGRPKGNNRPTCTGRQSGAGRGQRARTQVRARASVSGCRIRHRAPPALPRAQAKRGASEGWSTRAGRKTRTGSCSERRGAPHRRKTSRIVASRSLHGGRWKRSRSTEYHASRPAMAEA